MSKTGEEMWEERRLRKSLDYLNQKPNAVDMLHRGGSHLRVVREWVQRVARNGDRVTWGSYTPLVIPQLDMKELELLASHIAAVTIRDYLDNSNVSLAKRKLEEIGCKS